MPNDKEFELDDLESFSFDDLSLEEDPPASESSPGEDPFGVWVKSAPVDLDEVGNLPPSPSPEPEAVPASDIVASEATLTEEDFLSSEELANLDESFDFVTIEDPLEGETPLEDEVAFLNSPEAIEAERSAPPAFDEISLDDFVSFDEVPGSPSPGPVGAPATDLPEEEEFNTDFLDIDIDIEDDIKDEELEILEGVQPRSDDATEEISLDDFSAEEVDLSEFGDFEEVSPLADTEEPVAVAQEIPDLEPLTDLEFPSASGDDALGSGPVTEVAELEDFPDLGGLSEPALDPSFLTEEDGLFEEEVLEDSTDLDHILALEEDLTKGLRQAPAEEVEAVAPQQDLAALILDKIEKELSSIKQEISLLKEEMTSIKTAPVPAPAYEAPSVPSEDGPHQAQVSEVVETVDLGTNPPAPRPKEPKAPGGFFDDEDDETIALTGDELDNLLSTAEISEGEEAGMILEEDGFVPAVPAVDPDTEEVHVSDEEFLSGTSLDLNDPAPVTEEGGFGVPESIELEEGLPLDLDDETEDLLSGDQEIVLEDSNTEGPLPIPFDEEIGLELSEFPALEDGDELKAEFDAPEDPWEAPSVPEARTQAVAPAPAPVPLPPAPTNLTTGELTPVLKDELRAVLSYMDKLLASLPDDKIQEFAESEHFEVYKRLFEELGLIE